MANELVKEWLKPVGFDRKEAEKAKMATEKIQDFVKEKLKLE